MPIEAKQTSKKAGWLSISCGIWNMIMGFLFAFAFIFSSFDMGEEGYAKVGHLYKVIVENFSWIGIGLLIFGLISCILFIVGGVLLLKNNKNVRISICGLWGVYFYFLCFGVTAFLLGVSGGSLVTTFFWVGGCLLILAPTFFLQRMLSFS